MQKLLITSILVFSAMILNQDVKAAAETEKSVEIDVTKETEKPSENEMKALEEEMGTVGKGMEEAGKEIQKETEEAGKEMKEEMEEAGKEIKEEMGSKKPGAEEKE